MHDFTRETSSFLIQIDALLKDLLGDEHNPGHLEICQQALKNPNPDNLNELYELHITHRHYLKDLSNLIEHSEALQQKIIFRSRSLGNPLSLEEVNFLQKLDNIKSLYEDLLLTDERFPLRTPVPKNR